MITKTEMLILFELLVKKKMVVNEFKRVCSKAHFFHIAKHLRECGYMDSKIIDGSHKRVYFLTDRGYVLINMIGRDAKTPEKYRKFVNENIEVIY